jgi:site-specific recombinase XerD
MMLEELQRRDYSQNTTRAYVRVVRELAKHFHQPPNRLGPDHIRQFQAYLFRERKLEPRTVLQYSAGLRFFFIKTLKRHFMVDNIPLPKEPWKLPIILSQQEVSRLIDAASQPHAPRHSDDALLYRLADTTIHLTLQGKGGVGKSLVAVILAK